MAQELSHGVNVSPAHAQPRCGSVSEIVKSKIDDAEGATSAPKCNAHALWRDAGKDPVSRLGILIEWQGRESHFGKLVKVNDPAFTVLVLRKHDAIVQHIYVHPTQTYNLRSSHPGARCNCDDWLEPVKASLNQDLQFSGL